MWQIHEGASSIIWELAFNGPSWANSWATPLDCLLLNSTWEFWKLFFKNRVQAEIIQPNSLLSSTSKVHVIKLKVWSILASTNSPPSVLMHIIKPTLFSDEENDASMLHLYLPVVNFFHFSSSRLIDACCAVFVFPSLRALITWADLLSSNNWVAR